MTPISLIVFESVQSLGIGLAMVGLVLGIAIFRRIAMDRVLQAALFSGTLLLAFAAGRPIFNRSLPPTIVVMVDLSPSTRGATFRNPAALDHRIHQLLGDRPYQSLGFSDRNQPLDANAELNDLPADHTVFQPPMADAVLLFSDGRFALPPFAPPTYAVIDPAMDHPADAAIAGLSPAGNRVLATVTNTGTTRPVMWTGAIADIVPLPAGDFTQFATPHSTGDVTAALAPGDLWPENDSLTLVLPPALVARRWWIGADCPADWDGKQALPSVLADYLQAGVIVLDNITANELSSEQQRNLQAYVGELGGALVIVGGDHAFAAGRYEGSVLEELSPLASSPPLPSMRWILLADGSGSMAGNAWKTEIAAITGLIPQLPANDRLSVGSFSQSLTWWSHDDAASSTGKLQLPPFQVQPNGPTNLTTALADVASQSDGASPTQLMLMTDADASLDDPAKLTVALNAKKIHLHLMALGHGSALPALRDVAAATGGSVLEQDDPGQWVAAANQLLRSALPDRYQHQRFALIPGPGSVTEWNQTWLKPSASTIQKTSRSPMVARWQVGSGQVIGIAYPANSAMVQRLAGQIAEQPSDPRFDVKWDAGSMLRVTVNALDHGQFINGQLLTLMVSDAHSQTANPVEIPIPQTGPGFYELVIPASQSSQFLAVKQSGNLLRRFAVAGRYPAEFDAIGNDRMNLQALAERTGGSVIEPGPARSIDFRMRLSQADLSSEFAIAGFAVIGAALAGSRWRSRT